MIFDRVDIVREIQGTCLVTGGASVVVRSSHKVGKSHLLEHIYRSGSSESDAMFCRIDLDLLRTWADGRKMSDSVFYNFLVHRLHERLGASVASHARNEDTWKDEIKETDDKLAALRAATDIDSKELSTEIRRQRDFCRQQLHVLEGLRRVHAHSRELRDAPEIGVPNLVDLLDDLQAIEKRVVLFIDDFQRLLVEPGLTEGLFSFLRAANMDRKISTLATSQTHLMDGSLHGGSPERDSLFNHFNDVALEPFTDADADLFIDWLGGAALTSDERQYVRRLAGGSPFFLKTIHQHFLRRNRPQASAERDEFERGGLRDAVDAAFREIWRRCSHGQRMLLREVASGKAVATLSDDALRLKREGYLSVDGGAARTFSPLFASFISERADDLAPPEIEVGAELSYNVFPSALAFAQPKDTPLMRFTLTCPHGQKPMVEICCHLHGYAVAPTRRRVRLTPGAQQETLSIVFEAGKFRTLNTSQVVHVEYSVDVVDGGKTRPLGGDTKMLTVLANDNFVLARRDQTTHKLLDHTWMIAAWVQANEPALIPIAQRARDLFPSAPGTNPVDPAEVKRRVQSIYQALAEQRLKYHNSTLVFHHDDNDFAQRVRPPARVLQENAANCLEGSVLFASLLSAFEIPPLILFIPGHALVGWKSASGREFLETTLIATEPLEKALEAGGTEYARMRSLCEAWERNPVITIDNPRNFAILVDVHRVLKERQVQTLTIG